MPSTQFQKKMAYVLVLFMAGLSSSAFACRCPALSLRAAYQRADVIVVGGTMNVTVNAGNNGSVQIVRVSKSWKKSIPQELTVLSSTTCAFEFVEREKYLLYLYKTRNGDYYTSKCVGNLPALEAKEALNWLDRHGSIANKK